MALVEPSVLLALPVNPVPANVFAPQAKPCAAVFASMFKPATVTAELAAMLAQVVVPAKTEHVPAPLANSSVTALVWTYSPACKTAVAVEKPAEPFAKMDSV